MLRRSRILIAITAVLVMAAGCFSRPRQPLDTFRWVDEERNARKLIQGKNYREAESRINDLLREIYWTDNAGPDSTDYASALQVLATCFEAQGKRVEAERELNRIVGIYEQVFKRGYENTYFNSMILTLQQLAALHIEQGRVANATQQLGRSVALFEKHHSTFNKGGDDASFYSRTADLYARTGDLETAESFYGRAIESLGRESAKWQYEDWIATLQSRVEDVRHKRRESGSSR
jgi:tetratricopeptide (TPR) repeat protein